MRLLAQLTRPALLSAVPTLLAVLWLCARDALGGSAALWPLLLGGIGTAAVAVGLVERAWMALPFGRLPARSLGAARFALLSLAPAGVLWALCGSAGWTGPAFWAGPAALALGGALALAHRRLEGRFTDASDPHQAAAGLLAGLEVVALFVYVHRAEQTFVDMRPGTEALHALLYFGTWGASVALALPWALRVHGHRAAQALNRPRAALAALTAAGALAAIELDHRALVDLYPAVHVWLELVALVSLEAALALPWLAWAATPDASARRRARAGALAAAAGLSLLALPPTFAGVLHGKSLRDAALRAEVLDTAVGPALIKLAPRIKRDDRQHALLRYEQFLDVPPPRNDWSFVLVSSDALRADALAAPDEPDLGRSPRISRFAAERCAWFRNAYAPGSRTAIGMGGLMLGRYSAYIDWEFVIWKNSRLWRPHELTDEQREAFGDKFGYTTLPRLPERGNVAQRLQRAGVRTLAVPWDGFADFFSPGQGFEQGFDVYADLRKKNWKYPTSPEVVKHALGQLDAHLASRHGDRRFFQWIHLFDTHSTKGKVDVYREHVLATDAAIGELLDGLEQRKLLERTVFVLVSDHGEGLGQHRAATHGTNLHEEQVRVPLVLCLPGATPQRLEPPVSTLDAVATMLVLARADVDAIDGVNLLPLLLDGRYPKERPVFTELHRYRSNRVKRTTDHRAVRLGNWKLIVDYLNGGSRLYDLASDPEEKRNVLREHREVAARLSEILEAFVAEGERTHPLVQLEEP